MVNIVVIKVAIVTACIVSLLYLLVFQLYQLYKLPSQIPDWEESRDTHLKLSLLPLTISLPLWLSSTLGFGIERFLMEKINTIRIRIFRSVLVLAFLVNGTLFVAGLAAALVLSFEHVVHLVWRIYLWLLCVVLVGSACANYFIFFIGYKAETRVEETKNSRLTIWKKNHQACLRLVGTKDGQNLFNSIYANCSPLNTAADFLFMRYLEQFLIKNEPTIARDLVTLKKSTHANPDSTITCHICDQPILAQLPDSNLSTRRASRKDNAVVLCCCTIAVHSGCLIARMKSTVSCPFCRRCVLTTGDNQYQGHEGEDYLLL